jgi:hypothetical protein
MKRRYWISTKGKKTFLFSGVTMEPSPTLVVMYGMRECTKFRYYFTLWLKSLEKKWHKKS